MRELKWTKAGARAIGRLMIDPELRDAFFELTDGQQVTVYQRTAGSKDEEADFLWIKRFYLTERSSRQMARKDLGLRHFTKGERQLLEVHPDGKALLTRMRDGDEEAVGQAKSLAKEIKRGREDVGL